MLSSPALLLLHQIQPVLSFQNCPLLGPDFPAPGRLSTSTTINNATSALRDALNASLKDGPLKSSTSSFSIEIFSTHHTDSLFTFHHSAPILQTSDGTKSVDSNSIYRVGSISKLFTAYLFLIEEGDIHFNDPITKFLPELATAPSYSAYDSLNLVNWNALTVGGLASHLGGVPRDYLFDIAAASNVSAPGTPACAATGPCSRADFFKLVFAQPPVFPTSTTPVYSNVGYQLLSYALESITNKSYQDMLLRDLIQSLDLSSTSYATPNDTSHAAIPGTATDSGWNFNWGDFTRVGGIYSSENDLVTLGRSILSSQLLPVDLTRRWLKPHSFTSNPLLSVGAPWEIYRLQLSFPNAPRIVDLYTKSGDISAYHSNLVLVPDWDVGFVVLEAVGDPVDMKRNLISDMITEIFLPAVEMTASEEAEINFGGRYAALNSSVLITTEEGVPGLGVKEWVLEGVDYFVDVILRLGYVNPSVRLYPSGLNTDLNGGDVEVGWRAVYESNVTQPTGLFDDGCATWFSVDGVRVNGFGIDDFTFTFGEDGKAKSISLRGFNTTLHRA